MFYIQRLIIIKFSKLPNIEAYSDLFQTSKTELSVRVLNKFLKRIISDAWQCPESTSSILNINRYPIIAVLR